MKSFLLNWKFGDPNQCVTADFCSVFSELYVNWNENSGGGGGLKPVHFNFSEFWAEILNTERCAVYETEAIEKCYLV